MPLTILWCGGEDTSFQNGTIPNVITTTGHFRAGYARCSVGIPTANLIAKSAPFAGGAVTSAWMSCYVYFGSLTAAGPRIVGLGLSGTNKGLFLGTDSSNSSKLAICKYDGTTSTQLAAESGTSLSTGTPYRLDMQVVSFGASATVNLYLNGVLLVTYTGDVTVSGMSNFDSVFITAPGSVIRFEVSEIIVADGDTRALPGLVTGALTGDGTTTDWTGVYSTINQTTTSDVSPNYTNTAGQDQQFNITDLPSGVLDIAAVKLEVRAAKSIDATPANIALGYNSGGTVAVGADIALTTGYAVYEQLDAINPVTGVAFVQSEMNALQMNIRSKA